MRQRELERGWLYMPYRPFPQRPLPADFFVGKLGQGLGPTSAREKGTHLWLKWNSW